jgi:hypothetical protein
MRDHTTVLAVIDYARSKRYTQDGARDFWKDVGLHFGVSVYAEQECTSDEAAGTTKTSIK